jgi:hypothetical protein
MDSPYQYTLDIIYHNNEEYRQCLRRLFCMIPKEDSDDDLDDVTKDENNYDDEHAVKALDYLYDSTSHHPLFNHLYERAAGLMFSMDKSVGMSVLCSYDYLGFYHKCIQCFLKTPDEFNEQNEHYLSLKNALD